MQSAEVKEKAFRFDGIFTPTTIEKPIFLIEVQFQSKEDFYWEFLSEIFLYLNQQLRSVRLTTPLKPTHQHLDSLIIDVLLA
nr:DUF2887 domain-containing protein [Pseudanabaena sp. ABRG5-3]